MSDQFALDDTDLRLIQLLRADSRQSNRAIARDLEISEVTLRKRLKKLEESGAITFGLIVDVRATGMGVSGYLHVKARLSQAEAIAGWIADLNVCAMCCITTGPMNIRAFIYAKDSAELARILEDASLLDGVVSLVFQEAIGHAQHRYELIMSEGHATRRWGN